MRVALVLLFLSLTWRAGAEELSLNTPFASVAAFVSAAQNYNPAKSKTDLAKAFVVADPGPASRFIPPQVVADQILRSEHLWSNESRGLVIVTASAPTHSMRSVTGVLFLLTQKQGVWVIADHRQFVTYGKYARIAADLTADTGSGHQLGDEGMPPVVTIRATSGGREYSYKGFASYTFAGLKLRKLDFEKE